MTDERSAVDRRTVLKSMGMLTASVGLATTEGTAATAEPLAYGVGGYGEGPYPGGTSEDGSVRERNPGRSSRRGRGRGVDRRGADHR